MKIIKTYGILALIVIIYGFSAYMVSHQPQHSQLWSWLCVFSIAIFSIVGVIIFNKNEK